MPRFVFHQTGSEYNLSNGKHIQSKLKVYDEVFPGLQYQIDVKLLWGVIVDSLKYHGKMEGLMYLYL